MPRLPGREPWPELDGWLIGNETRELSGDLAQLDAMIGYVTGGVGECVTGPLRELVPTPRGHARG